MKTIILLAISLLISTLAKADVICQSHKFVGPTEVFSITDSSTSNAKVSWMHAADYSKLEEVVKYVMPSFSDKIIGFDYAYTKANCISSPQEKLLYFCGPNDFGNTDRLEDVRLHLASGTFLTLKALPDARTTVIRRNVIDSSGQIQVYEDHEVLVMFDFHIPGFPTLYANVEQRSSIYCQ